MVHCSIVICDWKRSSGWLESWEGLLLVTDVSTTCAEAIFRVKYYHLTLKMASAQVVETSVTNNSPSQDSNHPDDLFQSRQVVVLVSQKFKNPGERFDWSVDRLAVGKCVMWLAVKTCGEIGYANRWVATQLGLDMAFYAECKKTTVTSSSTVLEVTNCQPKSIKSIIKKEVLRKYEHEVEQQPCVGHFTVKQWKNDLDKRWCNISKVWKSIPSVIYSMHTGIFQQLLQTKVY